MRNSRLMTLHLETFFFLRNMCQAADHTAVGCVRLLVDVQYPTFCLVIVKKKTRKKNLDLRPLPLSLFHDS